MSKFNPSSLFTGVKAGAMNSYAILSNLYSDGLTKKNLTKALSDTNLLTSQYGTTFASYLSQNFGTYDKNSDGVLSADEVQKLMTQISAKGLTRDQVTSLGSMAGISADSQAMILEHFSEMDTNSDGYVSSGEAQAYVLQSKLQNQKIQDENKSIAHTSLFYGEDNAEDKMRSSLLSYKWMQDDSN